MSRPSPFDLIAEHTPVGVSPLPFVARPILADDLSAVEALHDLTFGPGALTRSAYRVRERQPRISPYCRGVFAGAKIVAAIRYTPVLVGNNASALLLGPLAVAPAFANQGHGRQLLAESLGAARRAAINCILLVGDHAYYERFGFVSVTPGHIQMPGPVDLSRLLILDFHVDLTNRKSGPARPRGRVVGAT